MKKLTVKTKILLSILFCFVLGICSMTAVLFGRTSSATDGAIVAEQLVEKDEPSSIIETDTLEAIDQYWPVGGDALAASNTINSASGLAGLAGKSGTYKLTGNIDLSGKIWTPISSFSGTLDGNGYTITGLTINSTISGSNIGLFATCTGTSTIKNLYLKGVNITTGGQYAAAFVGNSGSVKILNCGVSGGQITSTNSAARVAGILAEGGSAATAMVKNCFSEISLSSTASGSLVGGVGIGCYLYNSYFCGSISGSAGTKGLIGSYVGIQNCYGLSTGSTTPALYSNDLGSGTIVNALTLGGTPNPLDTSIWVKDTSGVMHGDSSKGKYVLRGVGNISVRYSITKYSASTDTTNAKYSATTGALEETESAEGLCRLWGSGSMEYSSGSYTYSSKTIEYTFTSTQVSFTHWKDDGSLGTITNGGYTPTISKQKASAQRQLVLCGCFFTENFI